MQQLTHLRRLLGQLAGIQPQVGGVRGLVRSVDPRQPDEVSRACARVEALWDRAARRSSSGVVDEHLEEGDAAFVVDRAREGAIGAVRAHRDTIAIAPKSAIRSAACAVRPHVLGAICGIEAEIAVEPMAEVVAVEAVGEPARRDGPPRRRPAMDDLPEPGRPVSQTAAPSQRPALLNRPRASARAVTRVGGARARGARLGHGLSRHRQDHARADGVVRRLVDEDEDAGRAVVAVLVEGERRRRAQVDAAELVEPELRRVARRGAAC